MRESFKFLVVSFWMERERERERGALRNGTGESVLYSKNPVKQPSHDKLKLGSGACLEVNPA